MSDPIRFPGAPLAHDESEPRAALSDRELREWLRHLTESQAALVAELHLITRQQPEAIRAGVTDGVVTALTDPRCVGRIMDAAIGVAQQRAAATSGRWLMGTAMRIARSWIVIGIVMVVTLKIAGPEAAAKLGTWLSKVAS